MNAAGKVALCAGVVGLSAIAELLVPSMVLAQASSGAGVLQPPRFILTCEALGRIKSEEQYFADILLKKEAQDCATNPSLKVAYSSERWRAAIDSVAQSLETERRSSYSNPAKYNQVLKQQDRLQYFSKLAPGIASETAAAIAKRSGDSPLEPMSFDDDTDPATRVTQFFNYLSVRAAFTDLELRANTILKSALDAGTLSPVLPINSIAITCADFADMLKGLSVAYAIMAEPVFAACYTKPNDPLAYDQRALLTFFDQVNAAISGQTVRLSAANFAPMGPLGQRYEKINEPYVEPYMEKQALLAAEEKRNAELAAAEQARIAAEQKRKTERAAKAAYEQALAKRFGSVPQAQRIVWEGSRESVSSVLTPAETAFNELNREILAADQTAAAGSQFRSSPKGEFEKTADYDVRIAAERNAFEIDQAKRLPSLIADLREAALQRLFGTPTITSVAYNADTETYRVEVAATRADYGVVLDIPVPLSRAEKAKSELQAATPLVLIDLSPSGLALKSVVLRNGEQWFDGTIVAATRSPIAFGPQSLAAWDARIAAQEAAQQVADRKAAAAQAVRDAEAARQARAERAARNKRFNHSGPYLRAGALVCVDMKGAMIADAISRSGNAYMATPDGCLVPDDDIAPLAEAEAAVGDFSRVRLRGATASGFTSSRNVIP